MKKILVLGANPAWQKTLFFKNFVPGEVNRAIKEENYPSGKGINLCRALRCSGVENFMLFQFAGGDNGQKLCSGLDIAGFPHTSVHTTGETRNCITCLDQHGFMTELIGVSKALSQKETDEMLAKLQNLLPGAGIMVITGSLPDGTYPGLYAAVARIAAENDVPLLIDTLVDVDKILSVSGKVILKVNREEFFKIAGVKSITEAHAVMMKKYPEKIFAVTNGAANATLSYSGKMYEYTLPSISAVSPLGAGDTAAAVMSVQYTMGKSCQEAFLYALAAASANCLNAKAGEYLPSDANWIVNKISLTEKRLIL